MVVAATLLLLFTRPLNIPSIVVYILAGLILGPIGLDVLVLELAHGGAHGETAVAVVAELGIVLLLFLVGLELSLDKIKAVGRVAVAAGIGQVVFTAVIGFGLALLLGFDLMASIFLATALTFSSTVVVVKLLDQKNHLHSLYGRIAIGIFLVQDLVVIIVLTILAGLGDPESMTTGSLALNLGQAFLGMGAMLLLALLAARTLLVKPMSWIARSAEATLIWSLCWCFAFVVGAEWLNLSPEIGAFLAGISLAQLPIAHDLRRRVHPLMNFFIAIFFIALGAQMELSAAIENWLPALILSAFVIIGNPFTFMLIISRQGYGEQTSFMTSVTVAQISEFSFIFAAVGLSAGLIDESILSLITLVGLITIGISSYMILYSEGLYERVRRWGLLKPFGAPSKIDETPEPPLRDHILVVGMNAMGRRLVKDLCQRGETVLALDTDAHKLAGLPCRTLVGNIAHPAVVEETSLARAKLVISTLRIEDTNNLIAYYSKRAGVPAAIHAFDPSVVYNLQRLDVDFLIDPKRPWLKRVIQELEEVQKL